MKLHLIIEDHVFPLATLHVLPELVVFAPIPSIIQPYLFFDLGQTLGGGSDKVVHGLGPPIYNIPLASWIVCSDFSPENIQSPNSPQRTPESPGLPNDISISQTPLCLSDARCPSGHQWLAYRSVMHRNHCRYPALHQHSQLLPI